MPPPFAELNVINLPSGDHVGPSLFSASWVNCKSPLPSGFMVNISNFPSLMPANVRRSPLGDQDGEALYFPSNVPPDITSRRVHYIYLRISAPVGHEGDLLAGWRP